MTTKLSESLRELRDEHAPEDGRIFLREALDQCIAQAEAQEKLSFFEARVKPSSDDPEAQAWELSQDWDEFKLQTILTNCQQRSSSEFHRETGAEMLIWLRDHGYLRPSLAIGEQTPVARDVEDLRTAYEAAAEVDRAGGDAPHAPAFGLAAWIRGRFAMEGRSPMSSEAQDKAIEAGNAMRVQLLALALDYRDAMLAKGGTELDLHPAHYDALDAWDQALSALRAERPPTISPKGPQEA